jgi:flagellar motor switch protein FliN/FliY
MTIRDRNDIDSVGTLRAGAPSPAGGPLLDQLELPLEVRLGRQVWSLERVLGLRIGDAVPVGLEGDDLVTLYVQDRPFAIGELVVVDGRFAFRVRELAHGGAP